MINSSEDIHPLLFGFRLLKLHGVNADGTCRCGNPYCINIGKHPNEPHGVKSARIDRDPSFFDDGNIGIACGQGLVVVDIDPRNGGHETLYQWQKEYGEFPETWQVLTGGQGYHLYFETAMADQVPNCKFEGIDIQSEGKYVVLPPSRHQTGRYYEWIFSPSDTLIAPLPPWLHTLIMSKRQKGQGETVGDPAYSLTDNEFRDLTAKLGHVDPSCGYETWVNIGMALHNTGHPKALEVWDQWSKASEKYQEGLCQKKWYSFKYKRKVEGSGAITPAFILSEYEKAVDIPIEIGAPERATELVIKPNEPKEGKEAEIKGLVKEISENILQTAPREYEDFAVASALAILSSAVQGSMLMPNLAGGKGLPISLYQWLIAPAAAGKNHYLDSVKKYVRAFEPRVLVPKLGSYYGLRAHLFAFNSGLSCIDEMQDELRRLGSRNNTYLNQILTEMKELTMGPESLEAIPTKQMVSPAIYHPYYSIFSVGTREGFFEHMTADIISGGLMSRFLMWDSGIDIPVRKEKATLDVPGFHKEALKTLHRVGWNDLARMQDYQDEQQKFHKASPKEPVVHSPQTVCIKSLQIDQKAKELYLAFAKKQETVYIDMVRDNLADSDLSPGSIYDRSAMLALKLASLHAVGREYSCVYEDDMAFGIRFAKAQSEHLGKLVAIHASSSPYEKRLKKVLALLAEPHRLANGATKSELLRALRIPGREAESIIVDLCVRGDIIAEKKIHEGYWEPHNIEVLGLIQRLRFRLNVVQKTPN